MPDEAVGENWKRVKHTKTRGRPRDLEKTMSMKTKSRGIQFNYLEKRSVSSHKTVQKQKLFVFSFFPIPSADLV